MTTTNPIRETHMPHNHPSRTEIPFILKRMWKLNAETSGADKGPAAIRRMETFQTMFNVTPAEMIMWTRFVQYGTTILTPTKLAEKCGSVISEGIRGPVVCITKAMREATGIDHQMLWEMGYRCNGVGSTIHACNWS